MAVFQADPANKKTSIFYQELAEGPGREPEVPSSQAVAEIPFRLG